MRLQKPLLERLLHECPDATGGNELFMVIGVMSTLAQENDLATLRGFVEGLSPSVLADVVIGNLDHMPRRADVAGAQDASSGTGALVSLMQVGALQPCGCASGPNPNACRLLTQDPLSTQCSISIIPADVICLIGVAELLDAHHSQQRGSV